ncbi:MAG: ChrR family anti-sigma-E factor [Alphaproteobacteria bacterium]|nr:ChrR family anti-sigma-E factor [Alphaproteobacteria bacterium]
MPVHHPEPERLMEYAAGAASPAMDVLIAAHLSLCPTCRKTVERLERMGGHMLESLGSDEDVVSMSPGAFDALLEKLDLPEEAPQAAAGDEIDPLPGVDLPAPIRETLRNLERPLEWRNRGKGIEEAEIPLPVDVDDSVRMSLLRIQPGRAVLEHTHDGGEELTMVLAGGFSDEHGHYVRGDVQTGDDELIHKPIADEGEVCVCLAVVEGNLRFTGPVGRVLNLFMRT